jgi:DNA ligase-1
VKRFARLYRSLDETTKTGLKITALKEYFERTPPEDAAWAVYFLTGRRPRRLVKASSLRQWAAEEAGVGEWLFAECYDTVGDLAETITLLLPEPSRPVDRPLHKWVEKHLLTLRDAPEEVQRMKIVAAWRDLDSDSRFVWNKMIMSGFRVGVSKKLVIRGLAAASGLEESVLAHRLMGDWKPSREFFQRLVAQDISDTTSSHPYPFCLAHPLADDPQTLGSTDRWLAEWKWDGIRAQIIRRSGRVFIWSRGGELVTDRFPEIRDRAKMLPDGTVVDGELLAWGPDGVLPFGELQRRIGRKTLGPKILREVPICCLAFDLLEYEAQSVRERPLHWRRRTLTHLLTQSPAAGAICLSKAVPFKTWDDLATLRDRSRERLVEGVMLKDLDAPYEVGRKTGVWWKWKVDLLTVDAVLIYAQHDRGRRASLYTDYTFAVWDADGSLVPFAKAYSGLTETEIRRVDRFVRLNTVERFGPVRSVKPELVFEIAFEAIRPSTRHRSGIAVRFPRIQRWRQDKRPHDANQVSDLHALLPRT